MFRLERDNQNILQCTADRESVVSKGEMYSNLSSLPLQITLQIGEEVFGAVDVIVHSLQLSSSHMVCIIVSFQNIFHIVDYEAL